MAAASMRERRPEVQSQGKFEGPFLGRHSYRARRVPVVLKAGKPPRFGLVAIDRLGVVAPPPWMGDMVDTAAQRAAIPCVQNVESQRGVNRDRRVKTRRWLSCLEAYAGDGLARAFGIRHRQPAAIAGDHVPALDKAVDLDLQSLD